MPGSCTHCSRTALNEQLKFLRSNVTIVAFFITPAPARSFTVEALKGQAVTKQLRDTVNEITQQIGQRIFDETVRYAAAAGAAAAAAAAWRRGPPGSALTNEPAIAAPVRWGIAPPSGKIPDTKDLLSQEDMVLLKRRIFALKRDTLPPIVTHNMVDDANDPILKHLRRVNLFNRPQDRVKVVFHPEFLNSNNPLFGLDYEDFVRGCHLGVFPSYYEPWYVRRARAVGASVIGGMLTRALRGRPAPRNRSLGARGYTPAECTVMGVPSITTNLAGFGSFIQEKVERPSDYGIYIVDRRMKAPNESIEQMADFMLTFASKRCVDGLLGRTPPPPPSRALTRRCRRSRPGGRLRCLQPPPANQPAQPDRAPQRPAGLEDDGVGIRQGTDTGQPRAPRRWGY